MQSKTAFYHSFICWAIYLAICSVIPTTLAAEVDNNIDSYNLSNKLYWFEDKSQLMTINDIISPHSLDRFQIHSNDSFNLGINDSNIWIKLNLSTLPLNQAIDAWFLSIENPLLEDIEIYRFNNNELSEKTIMGSSLAFENRPIKQRNFIYPINSLEKGELKLYIKIHSSGTLKIPLYLYSDARILEKTIHNNIYYGMYFGAIFGFALYNLLQFIQTRERFFLYSLGYLVSFGGAQATINGYSFQYIWPQLPALTPPFTIALLSFCSVFGLLLCKRFLAHSKRPVHFAITLNTALILAICLAFLSPYINHQLAVEIMLMLTMATVFAITAACFSSIKYGDKSSYLFLLSWGCIIPCVIAYSLMSADYINTSIFIEYAIPTGSVLQAVLLSLALGNRIREKQIRQINTETNAKQSLLESNDNLQTQNTRLEEQCALKDSFLATISQELRTPITSIDGSLNLINTKNLDHQLYSYIHAARESAKTLTSLIDSILHFSEIQAGTAKIKKESFEIRPSFNHLIESFRTRCQAKGIVFNWHIDKAVPSYIVGDVNQLQLVISQLMDNAIKYTEQGTVGATISTHADQLILTVNDTGSGINQAQLDIIFQEFQRSDADYIRHHSGLGIGLLISHRLSLLMKGQLQVESALGEGSVFTFSIPLVIPNIIHHREEILTLNHTKEKVVLVAEDNPVNQMVLKGMLEKMGCLVLTADHGEQAIELLKQQPVDIILMDCQMPIMDGFKTTQVIRQASNAYSTTPIIAVTASAMSGDNERCIAEGMNDYLKKPIDRNLLEQKIIYWLNETT